MNKVLIIEDEMITAENVQKALALKHVVSDIAVNGVIGLEMFKKGDYDLVLLDLTMPEMNGDKVLMEMRQIDPFVDVIIYTAGYVFDELKALANIGIDGYVNKGSEANLPDLIDMIMAKLAPLDEDGLEQLIQHSPG